MLHEIQDPDVQRPEVTPLVRTVKFSRLLQRGHSRCPVTFSAGANVGGAQYVRFTWARAERICGAMALKTEVVMSPE